MRRDRSERDANAILAAKVQEDEAFRQEALRKLAPNPAARHALKQARHGAAAKQGPSLFIRVLRSLRGSR